MFVRRPYIKEENVEHIDWLFTEYEPPATEIQAYLLKVPQLKFYLPNDSVKNEWMLLENTYTANGTENFLKIGCFVPEKDIETINKKRAELDGTGMQYKTSSKKRSKKDDELFRKQINEFSKKRNQINGKADRTFFLFDDFCLSPIQADGTHRTDEPDKIPEVGTTIKMENVFFETGQSILLETSYTELNKITDMLNKYVSLEIQVKGHTDNTGDKTENLNLSEARAKAVVAYLVNKGVEPSRLSYKGYGSSVPIANNNTEDGKALNRRVEFTVRKK